MNWSLLNFPGAISPDKTIKAWGFNEMVPGPTLEAEKGDRIVVKVTNNLPEATVIHWHGIQLPQAWMEPIRSKLPLLLGKVSNTLLLFLMLEHSGITRIKTKLYKWNVACTARSL